MQILWKLQLDNKPNQMHALFPPLIVDGLRTPSGVKQVAIVAGVFLSIERPELIGVSFQQAGLTLGTGYALICAFFWAGSTVAGDSPRSIG